jgi:hypothetical protein
MASLIKPVTSDHDLIELADRIGVHIDDILESNEITKPLPKHGTFLILLRPPDLDVGHWVCVHNHNYFDSMAEPAPPAFGKMKYNEIQYQGSFSEYCGIFCLMWLFSKQHNRPDLLKGFHDLNLYILY